MFNKIKISKDELIVFMGSMNAMPMMYALELKNMGYDVLYFVDAPTSNSLSRPENHFPEIQYPYPGWIIELNIPTQMMLPYLSPIHARNMLKHIKQFSDKKISCFVLNGFFISLSPWLKKLGKVVALTHGSDLDVWANKSNVTNLSDSFSKRSIFKFLPKTISRALIKKAVNRQYLGLSNADAVIYFPAGLNRAGDEVIKSLSEHGVNTFSRYDISFHPVRDESREFKTPQNKTVLFSGVRFLYKTFPDGNKEYSKGNDIIIQGISDYYKRNKNIEVHFVEKGEDVLHAKALCSQLGIEEAVIWHKEMPFKSLLNIYQRSDICFDQTGSHWVGAIGAYALYLGKPLIANISTAVRAGIFPANNPILSSQSASDVFDALVVLENIDFRKKISDESRTFVEDYMSPLKLLDKIFFGIERFHNNHLK